MDEEAEEHKNDINKRLVQKYGLLREHRESLATGSSHFINNLRWSDWCLAICVGPTQSQRNLFCKRRHGGRRRKTLFSNECFRHAVYEFSVQTRPYGDKVVVYGCITDGFDNAHSWEHALINQRVVQYQIDNVLSFNCRVYVRRATLRGRDKVRAARELKNIDYAWTDSRGTGKHRKLSLDRIPISLEFYHRKPP